MSPVTTDDSLLKVKSIEEVTGVSDAVKDSHKQKFLRGPLNLLLGDHASPLAPGIPLRREPHNLATGEETPE